MNAYRAQVNQNYQKVQVESASPEKLILMLYDGAIRKLVLARSHFDQGEDEGFLTQVLKVQKIVSELMMALDREQGGEVASNLSRIYEYILRQLALSAMRKDPELLIEVKTLMHELRSGWQEAIQKEMGDPTAPLPDEILAPARVRSGALQTPALAGINIEG